MLYFDTSILVPLLIPESSSDAVEAFIRGIPSGSALVVSQWGRVEFASVLSRLARMRELDRAVATACADRFDALIAESFDLVMPGSADFERCWDFLCRFDTGLRAGDALHLAIAANIKASVVYTLDKGMLDAGRLLGLPVERGIPE